MCNQRFAAYDDPTASNIQLMRKYLPSALYVNYKPMVKRFIDTTTFNFYFLVVENTDQISRKKLEEGEHENNVADISQNPTSLE